LELIADCQAVGAWFNQLRFCQAVALV
jgi:hypothetical protein